MIKTILTKNYESEITAILKEHFKNEVTLSKVDIRALKNYETEDYALLGIIGLLIDNKPRILLGKKQPYDIEIMNWCNGIDIGIEVLEKVADKYLDDDFSKEQEVILRKVMLEYPKK